MTEYRQNPALQETRTPLDVFKTFSKTEQKAYRTMTEDEVVYLKDECGIEEYVNHLRKGARNEVGGAEFPIPVARGNHFQLERYKTTFLLRLVDYQGTRECTPSDFQLGNDEILQDLKYFPGVVIIRIPAGASTTQGLDEHRVDLIAGVLATRQDLFNPTIVLAEESIAGKLNQPSHLINIFIFDKDKLRSDYEGNRVAVDTSIKSRKKEVQNNYPKKFNSDNSNREGAMEQAKNNKETAVPTKEAREQLKEAANSWVNIPA